MEREQYPRELIVPNYEYQLPEMERRDMPQVTPPVVTFEDAPATELISFKEHLLKLRERQEYLNKNELGKDYARMTITSDTPIGIVFSSDWHIGAKGMDINTFEKHMDLIKEEPNLFMMLGSNTIDNYIWVDGVFGQIEHPSQQRVILKEFVDEYQDKLLAVTGSKCHEGWSGKADFDPNLDMFFQALKRGTAFFPGGGIVDLTLKDTPESEGIGYQIYITHEARFHSALNPNNAGRRLTQLKYPDADIVAIGHHHVANVENAPVHEGKKDVSWFRMGTYKIDDLYSMQKGFGKGQLGGTMAILDPKRKSVLPFLRIEDGVQILRAMRELEQYKKTYGGD